MSIPMRSIHSASRAVPVLSLALLLALLAGCAGIPPAVTPASTAAPVAPAVTRTAGAGPTPAPAMPMPNDLTPEQLTTLNTLARVDDHPLYVMHYSGAYSAAAALLPFAGPPPIAGAETCPAAWGCALFAAMGDASNPLYGRNFDWRLSPAVLLFTDPPDGYAAVTMVNLEYVGLTPDEAKSLDTLPLAERRNLLYAPYAPIDGMNEHGLVIGMAAVPGSFPIWDPNKETVDSLDIMREVLDRARTVDGAVAVLREYNIDQGSGPVLHYLVADRSGRASLVEFDEQGAIVIPSDVPWHAATNHLRAGRPATSNGGCSRYETIRARLAETAGRVSITGALELLSGTSQSGLGSTTQWSVVYVMATGEVRVVMGGAYDVVHTFRLPIAPQS